MSTGGRNDVLAGFAKNVFGAGLSGAPAAVPVTDPAADGPLGRLHAQQQAHRNWLQSAPDMTAPAQAIVQRAWDGILEQIERDFGRRPSTDPWQQDDAAMPALREAERTGSEYVALSTSGAGAQVLAEAFDRLCAAIARWGSVVTASWPSKTVYEAERRKLESWY